MTTTPPDTVTCPYGHTFPRSQLTVRAGQYVCPVCDSAPWATPRAPREWSRTLLRAPLVLLVVATLLEVGLQVTTVGLGVVYADQNLGGSGWLLVNAALSVVGMAAVVVGVLALLQPLALGGWTRHRLFAPLVVIGAGLALSGVGGLFGIGLNLSLLTISSPGAGWQLAGQVLDALSSLALGGVAIWIAVVLRTSAATEGSAPVRQD